MGTGDLLRALKMLTSAVSEVESVLATMRTEHDPLALHIFARRHFRNVPDTKSGKRRDMISMVSYRAACDLGFNGSFDEWARLMGAAPRK
jgi:hypothetical protein